MYRVGVGMGYVVGVDFGSTKTTVAIATRDDNAALVAESPAVVATIHSVVFLDDLDDLVVGDRAEALGLASPHRVIRDFKRRLGDSVPVMADGWSAPAESIVATVIGELVRDIADGQGAAPEALTVTYPANWGSYKQALLVGALDRAGLPNTQLVTEPAAAVMDAVGRHSAHSTVIVYDLGGDGFEASTMTRSADGVFEIIGCPQEIDWVGGGEFDQVVFSHVQRCSGLDTLDVADPAVLDAMRDLRLACRTAKEALSLDTEATIPVNTPQLRTRIRIVRSEFDELISDAIEDTLDATRRCMSSAGLATADIDAIVLVGGSSRIPLVAQMISAEFELPLIIGNQPDASIALGAAQFAALAGQPAPVAASALPLSLVSTPSAPSPSVSLPLVSLPLVSLPLVSLPVVSSSAEDDGVEPAFAATPVPAVAGTPSLQSQSSGQPSHLPSQPSLSRPLPSQLSQLPAAAAGPAAGATPPAVRVDQIGRHRHRVRRRYWLKTTGIVASVAGVLLLGSSITASRAAETSVPSGSPQQRGSMATTTPAPVADRRDGLGANGTPLVISPSTEAPLKTSPGTSVPPGRGVAAVAEDSAPASAEPLVGPDTGPAPVNAPAVVMALAAGQVATGTTQPSASGGPNANR